MVVTSEVWTWVVLYVMLLFMVVHSNKVGRVVIIVLSVAVGIGMDYGMERLGWLRVGVAWPLTVSVVMGMMVRHYVMSMVMGLWGVVTAYGSVYTGVVNWDVMVSVVVGMAMGGAVYGAQYMTMKRWVVAPKYISRKYSRSGYFKGDVYAVGIVVVLTWMYGLFRSLFAL